jgi:hypothetical protein
MLQGKNFSFIFESKHPKLKSIFFKSSCSYFDHIILWCYIQNQIFVVHGFFNASNHTTSRYQHIYIFESRHELGFLSNYNWWLRNMLMGSWMSIHQILECCKLQQYEVLKCNLTSHSSSKFFINFNAHISKFFF